MFLKGKTRWEARCCAADRREGEPEYKYVDRDVLTPLSLPTSTFSFRLIYIFGKQGNMKSTALLRVLQATFSFLTVSSCTDSQQPLQGNLHSQHIAGGRACQDDIPTSTFDYCQYCTSTTTTTSGYTITHTPCVPSSKYVRTATGLNAPEISWQSKRSVSAVKAMATYFPSAWGANNPQYNLTQLLKDPPRIGLAFSGGGFRAMLGGAGVLQAYDTSPNGGIAGVSGILDSSLYITGLSGGGWLVGSWALNGYPNVTTLVRLSWSDIFGACVDVCG